MLYRQMQYFISVVDCQSFTEAAEQNYISQSAISQQIRALEQELGVALLVRENRKFHLTAAGEYFYRHAREQRYTEQDFYESNLGFGGSFIFAESLEEGRLMIVGNRGFMPIEIVGTMPPPSPTVKRLPIYRGSDKIQRNYCAFWAKEKSNYYIEEFAEILKRLLH